MPAQNSSRMTVAGSTRNRRSLRNVRDARPAAKSETAIPVAEASPLHSVEALAGAVFVASIAACWIAVASTTTAPLVAAGQFLTRVVSGSR